MNIKDIIFRKENNYKLTRDEIYYFVQGYTLGFINDDDMTLLLKSICKNEMDEEETFYLTEAMIKSGDVMDLSSIPGVKVDKHSTGGVGDKTTLIVAPLVSACGVSVAKLSGRGLGHTGGTIDKLESIKGFKSDLTEQAFIKQVKDIGIVDASQTKELVPADKKMYALRDVTGTTNSISLIASSIMSKKIASGADKILLDVKTGSGALITKLEDSIKLAKLMVSIGKKYGKETIALITDMNEPLGTAIGNGLEVEEAIKVLEGNGENRITKLSIAIASYMVSMGKEISLEDSIKEVLEVYNSKKGLEKFKEFIKYQGGDINNISIACNKKQIYSKMDGYIYDIDEIALAKECQKMGSGRFKKDDIIDYGVGMICNKVIGQYVNKGDLLATIYYNQKQADCNNIENAFKLSSNQQEKYPLVYTIIK